MKNCKECMKQQAEGDFERTMTTLKLTGSNGILVVIGCIPHLTELVRAIGAAAYVSDVKKN